MKMKTLQDLLVDLLKDLYSAENQLVKALPKMARAAANAELKAGFEMHLEETKQQAARIEEICEMLQVTPKGKKCVGMEGLIEEGNELMGTKADASVLDAGLIGAAQKVEHYEIAAYGTARTWAEQLDLGDAVELLDQSLAEEKETDVKLTDIATAIVNEEAEAGADDEEEGAEDEETATTGRRGGRR
jgi:ferritin-like metal-binding protein YciE